MLWPVVETCAVLSRRDCAATSGGKDQSLVPDTTERVEIVYPDDVKQSSLDEERSVLFRWLDRYRFLAKALRHRLVSNSAVAEG